MLRVAPARAPLLLLAAVVAVVHGRALAFGITALDDLTLLVDDRAFLDAPGAWWHAFQRAYFQVVDAAHAYYRPVVTATYVFDTRAFGGEPVGYHATNVALWMVAACLVYALLVRAQLGRAVALGAAVVFAVHPALVSAVAWIPGRNDSLLAVFTLGALLSHRRAPAVHVACFAIALFTKETAIVVPLLCLAWSALVERAPFRRRDALEWLGWGAALALFVFARRHALAESAAFARAFDWRAPLRHVSVLVSSVGEILLPVHQAPIATIEDTPLWPGLVSLGCLVASIVAIRRAAPIRMGVVAFGAALYVLTLAPALFVGGSLALENRLVLPCIGVLLVIAEPLSKLQTERGLAIAFASVTTIALAALTLGAEGAYRDPLAFGKAAVEGAPHSALAHFTLGRARHLRGDEAGALGEYGYALVLDPAEPMVHNNLAVIFMRRADWARAETELEAELAINPGYPNALDNLAVVRRRRREGD